MLCVGMPNFHSLMLIVHGYKESHKLISSFHPITVLSTTQSHPPKKKKRPATYILLNTTKV